MIALRAPSAKGQAFHRPFVLFVRLAIDADDGKARPLHDFARTEEASILPGPAGILWE